MCRYRTRYSCQILMKFENFLDIFFRKALTYHISWKSIQCGPGFCMRTSDGQKKLMVVFRNFAKAPEKKKAMWNFNRIWAHGADPHIKCLWWMLFFMMESWAFQGVQYSSSSRRWTSFSSGKFWPSQRHLSISLDPGRMLSSFQSSFGKYTV